MQGKATQPYMCTYPFSPRLPSRPGCHVTLSRVPCSLCYVLIEGLWTLNLSKFQFHLLWNRYERVEPDWLVICLSPVCTSVLSCLVMSDSVWPQDGSSPGSSVYGVFQAGILDWVSIPFFWASSQPRDSTHVPCVSCLGNQILCHFTTWEAQLSSHYWFIYQAITALGVLVNINKVKCCEE